MRQKMFWNEEIETMSRDDLEELQLKKLQSTVKRAFDKIPYYHKRYSEAEVFPEDINLIPIDNNIKSNTITIIIDGFADEKTKKEKKKRYQ
jgi:hypothetical protein